MALTATPAAIAELVSAALQAHTDAPDPHPQYARAASGALILPLLDVDPDAPTAGALLIGAVQLVLSLIPDKAQP